MLPTELQEKDLRRLARAQWAPTVGPFVAFGRSWSVQTDDPDLATLIEDLFADLFSDHAKAVEHTTFCVATENGPRSLVARDALRLGSGGSPATTMDLLIWGINRWVLDNASPDYLLLHAGGVVREDGLAVLLPAPSESGKSTLTMGLLERGYSYLSDEAIALMPDGTVQGYAKPVSIDRGAWGLFSAHGPAPNSGAPYLDRQWQIRASRVSAVAPEGRLKIVVFPRFDPRTSRSVDRLSPAEVLGQAGTSLFGPRGSEQIDLPQLNLLAAALSGVPAYRLLTNDLDWSCRAIGSLLAETSQR